jgi:hypothetical protein
MPNIMEMIFGNSDRNVQQSTLNQGQEGFLGQLMQQLQQMGGEGGGMNQAMQTLMGFLDPNSEQYKNFEAPYMQQFNQQTIPGLAEKFAGFGGGMGGGLSSSGFGQALGAAGGNLQTQLAQMKSQMQRQSVNDLFGQYNQMANQGLGTRAFENQYQPGSTGLLGGISSGLAGGLGLGAGPQIGKSISNQLFGG